MLDGNGNELKQTGNCFENTVKYILDVNRESDLTLVHCIVSGQKHLEGIEFSHAFIIARNRFDGEVIECALDLTTDTDNPVMLPLGYYRDLGKVRNEIYYTREETRRMVIEYTHFGPWDESIQTEADRFCETSA